MYTHRDFTPHEVLESKDINNNFRMIFNDIRDLYTRVRSIKSDQMILSSVAENASSVVSASIEELKLQASLLEPDIVVRSLYSSTGVIFPTSELATPANHEADYGRAILNTTTTQRYLVTVDPDTGELVPIDDIQNYLDWYSSSDRIVSNMDEILETDISSAFDSDPQKLYMRKFTTSDDSVTGVDLLITTTLPVPGSIVNSIKVSPFPEGIVDITSLTYESNGSSGLTFQKPSGEYYNEAYSNTRKMSFAIRPTEIDGIRLFLEQHNKKYDGPYSFFLGLHSIILENCLYENTSYIGFELTREDGNISSIEQIKTNLDDDVIVHPVSFRIYTTRDDFDEMNTSYIYDSSNSAPITPANPLATSGDYDTIYILFKLQKYEFESTPELKHLLVKWS